VVTATGTDFPNGGGFSCLFGATKSSAATWVSSTQVKCTTAAGSSATTIAISVSPDGATYTGNGTHPVEFSYYVSHPIARLVPSAAPRTGGTLLTVVGAGSVFTAGMGITLCSFGDSMTVAATRTSADNILCYMPAISTDVYASLRPISVALNGQDFVGGQSLSLYDPPEIMGLSPSAGSVGGGTPVTVTAQGVRCLSCTAPPCPTCPDLRCRFGSGVSVGTFTKESLPRIMCLSPAAAVGDVNVSISINEVDFTSAFRYTYYTQPLITAVIPDVGPQVGGIPVTLHGSGFLSNFTSISCKFGSAISRKGTVVNSTLASCVLPMGLNSPGSKLGVAVALNDADFTAFTHDSLAGVAFRYHRPIELRSLTPTTAVVQGGTPVSIAAQLSAEIPDAPVFCNFRWPALLETAPTTVKGVRPSNGAPNSFTCVAPVWPTTNTTPRALLHGGSVAIEVSHTGLDPDWTLTVPTKTLEYRTLPLLSSVTPAYGDILGGTEITVTAKQLGLSVGEEVYCHFDGDLNGFAPAVRGRVISENTIGCHPPPAALGEVRLEIGYNGIDHTVTSTASLLAQAATHTSNATTTTVTGTPAPRGHPGPPSRPPDARDPRGPTQPPTGMSQPLPSKQPGRSQPPRRTLRSQAGLHLRAVNDTTTTATAATEANGTVSPNATTTAVNGTTSAVSGTAVAVNGTTVAPCINGTMLVANGTLGVNGTLLNGTAVMNGTMLLVNCTNTTNVTVVEKTGLRLDIVCPLGQATVGRQCRTCGRGTYNNRLGASFCAHCPPGAVSQGGAAECAPCPNATSPNTNHSVCLPCERGTYASLPGRPLGCDPCPPGSTSPPGAANCTQCPHPLTCDTHGCPTCQLCPGYVASTMDAFGDHCACKQGFYTPYHNNDHCAPCPLGGVCLGGLASSAITYNISVHTKVPVSPRPYGGRGYWSDNRTVVNQDAPLVFRCRPIDACVGPSGEGGRCAVGRQGTMCSECAPGFTKALGTVCIEAGFGAAVVSLAVLVVLWLLAAWIVAIGWDAISIGLMQVQLVSVVGQYNLGWPTSLQELFGTLALSNYSYIVQIPGWDFPGLAISNVAYPILVAGGWWTMQLSRYISHVYAQRRAKRSFGVVDPEDLAQQMREQNPEGRVYMVAVQTGFRLGAGTDSKVFVQLYGSEGESAEVPLETALFHANMFERGQTDVFMVPSEHDLGAIRKLRIWHDNTAPGAAWFLDSVRVQECVAQPSRQDVRSGASPPPPAGTRATFICSKWLPDKPDSPAEVILEPAKGVKWQPSAFLSQWDSTLDTAISNSVSFARLAFFAVAIQSYKTVRCTRLYDGDGGHVLTAHPALQCGSPEHSAVLAMGVLGIIVTVGWVGFTGIVLWHGHIYKCLLSSTFSTRFGFMYMHLKPNRVWWELVVLVRRILFAAVAAAIDDPMVQVVVTWMLVLASMMLHLTVRPFSSVLLDFLEIAGFLLTSIVLALGSRAHERTHPALVTWDPPTLPAVVVFVILYLIAIAGIALWATQVSLRENVAKLRPSKATAAATGVATMRALNKLKRGLRRGKSTSTVSATPTKRDPVAHEMDMFDRFQKEAEEKSKRWNLTPMSGPGWDRQFVSPVKPSWQHPDITVHWPDPKDVVLPNGMQILDTSIARVTPKPKIYIPPPPPPPPRQDPLLPVKTKRLDLTAGKAREWGDMV